MIAPRTLLTLLAAAAAAALAVAVAASSRSPARCARSGPPAAGAALAGPAGPAAVAQPAPPGPGPGGPEASGRRAPRYRWPTGEEAALVRDFAPPAERWLAGHRGVDLEAAEGSAVLAAGDGVVAFAGMVAGRPVVSVDHPDGIRTTYEPVEPAVVAGQRVRAGETLGHLVAGHCPVWTLTTCLHFGARTGRDTYLDPMRLLGARAVVRLLPPDLDLVAR
ncbi:M23 family metallopeptidase [Georgenia sp. TF02-10]|uniref:M23 family metallopeptidase n=1 Tax=Georgenia sp. TF02-10 TaxID=2917725 RepID=UPI001FA764D6|nr:M23 family metallopeptidase [Georgenia sp. TF02-10]UNX55902.1 M23 family metallopeptidase [Georgenia sp. TF02-10]